MPFSSILSRHMMDSVAKYRPYIFEGDHWTDQEKERIARFLAPHVPERVYPNFNEWHFFKDAADRFLVLRVTYEKGSYYRSLDGVIGELMDDYGGSNFMVYLDPAAPVVYRYSRFGQDEALETTDLQAAIAYCQAGPGQAGNIYIGHKLAVYLDDGHISYAGSFNQATGRFQE
jgi:hypothetical protein